MQARVRARRLELPDANTLDPLYNSPLGKLPDGVMGRVVANLDRQSAVNLAKTNAAWNKPLTTLGCGFDTTDPPSNCQGSVDYDPKTINHALMCAVHKSKALSLPGMPGLTADPYLHLTVRSDKVDEVNAYKPLRCFVESGFPLDVKLIYTEYDLRSFIAVEGVTQMCVTHDAKHVVLASTSNNDYNDYITVWELDTGRKKQSFTHQGKVYSMCSIPDGNVVTSSNSKLFVWNPETGQLAHTLPTAAYVMHVTPDGAHLVAEGFRRVSVWQLSDYTYKDTIGSDANILNICATNAHVVINRGKWGVLVFTLHNGTVLTGSLGSNVSNMCATPDGAHVITFTPTHARVFKLRDGWILREDSGVILWNGENADVDRLCEQFWVTPDGAHLLMRSAHGLSMWRLDTAEKVRTFKVGDVMCEPAGGAHIVTFSTDHCTVRKWPLFPPRVAGVLPSFLMK